MANTCSDLPPILVISDSMGITGTTLARSAASHFGRTNATVEILPNVRSMEEIDAFLVKQAEKRRESCGSDELVLLYTLVIDELRDDLQAYLAERPHIHAVDVLSGPIDAIEEVSGEKHETTPGEQHALNENYFKRIEALEFTVSHDDGLHTQDLADADIVILGVSRASKTPTSIYLGQQGYKVANIPLVPGVELPREIYDVDRSRLFGLITDPSVLVGVRSTRMGGSLGEQSQYANLDAVVEELEQSRTIMRGLGCVIINTKDRAIEETAQEILKHYHAVFPSA